MNHVIDHLKLLTLCKTQVRNVKILNNRLCSSLRKFCREFFHTPSNEYLYWYAGISLSVHPSAYTYVCLSVYKILLYLCHKLLLWYSIEILYIH